MDRLGRVGFFVGDWRVEPLLHRVSRGGRTTQLEPKLIDVLVYLAGRAGEVVTRDQIMDDVWADTIVTDHALTRSISELRKVFGDNSKNPSFIETIPKTGYRLVAPVTVIETSSDGRADALSMSVHVPPRSPGTGIWLRPGGIALAAAAVIAVALVVAANTVWDRSPETSITPLPLTALPGRELMPAFSPDGEQIAFSWARAPFEAERHLYVKQVRSENAVPVTSGSGQHVYPAWSPDGQQIAFLRLTEESCDIYVVSSLGTSERKITECGMDARDLAWSPDGSTLAFAGRASHAEPRAIHLLHLATLERRALTHPPAYDYGDDLPVFSPDGRTLAFRRSRSPGISDLYTISPSDPEARPRRLTFDQRMVFGFDWTTDGRELVMSSNRSGLYRLWRVSAAGERTKPQESITAWDPGRPVVARTGRRLAYVEWFFDVNVWRAPLGSEGSREKVLASTRTDYLPSFSPDGGRIAFTSDRSGSSEIWVADRDGGRPVKITSFGNPSTRSPAWSPDGRFLAFFTNPEGHAQLFVVDAEGGIPRPLVADTSDAVAPSWSHDGRWIYFGSNRTGDWQIWKIPAEGGRPIAVTTGSGYAAKESPDGATLYFSKYTEDGLFALDLSTREKTVIVPDFDAVNWSAWTVAPDGVYYLMRERETSRLFRVNPTGEPSLIREFDCIFLEQNSGLAVAPDGREFLTSCIDQMDSDIMLVEHFH